MWKSQVKCSLFKIASIRWGQYNDTDLHQIFTRPDMLARSTIGEDLSIKLYYSPISAVLSVPSKQHSALMATEDKQHHCLEPHNEKAHDCHMSGSTTWNIMNNVV